MSRSFLRPALFIVLTGCALRPYTFGVTDGTTGEVGTTTTGPTSTSTSTAGPTEPTTAAGSDEDSAAPGFAFQPDLGPIDPWWPALPCTYHANCPSGQCIDPDEFPLVPSTEQRYCLGLIPPELECNPWASDPGCPDGYKCGHAGWDGGGSGCVPVLPDGAPAGSPCEWLGPYAVDQYGSGLYVDTCDHDSGCFDGFCRTLCEFEPDYYPHCPPGQYCNGGRISMWCIPFCNPLLQDCPDGQVCIYTNDGSYYFSCIEQGSGGQIFDPCEYINDCDPGLFCADSKGAVECDPSASGCCLPWCDVDAAGCPGAGQECLAWYLPDEAPEGFEDVGVCYIPQ